MKEEIKPWRRMIAMFLLLLLPGLSACAKAKIYFYNDSNKIISGDANVQPPIMTYDWTCMSKGNYRNITTANPQ